MLPSPEQIRIAAYHRWRRRGGAHGQDGEDWLAAEQDLLFSLNYRVSARYRLDGVGPLYLGSGDDPRCRFCEQSAPRATFSGPALALPGSAGNESIFASDQCDECRDQFRDTIEADFERFSRPLRLGEVSSPPRSIPVGAYKGLVRMAIALLPEEELPDFEDAIEWVSNPDHGLDRNAFAGLECTLGLLPDPSPFSWAALASRVEHDAPMPARLFALGTGRATFQLPLPLCLRDEELDGARVVIPRIPTPFGPGRTPPDLLPTTLSVAVGTASPDTPRASR